MTDRVVFLVSVLVFMWSLAETNRQKRIAPDENPGAGVSLIGLTSSVAMLFSFLYIFLIGG